MKPLYNPCKSRVIFSCCMQYNTVRKMGIYFDLCMADAKTAAVSLCLLTHTLIPHRWQLNNGVKATPKALKAALCEMKLMSIVDKYFEGV